MNMRTTRTELVLDFGAHFPENPNPGSGQVDFAPEARIVLHVGALPMLAAIFTRAAEVQKNASQKMQQPPAKAQ
jgi:hypothetical protein